MCGNCDAGDAVSRIKFVRARDLWNFGVQRPRKLSAEQVAGFPAKMVQLRWTLFSRFCFFPVITRMINIEKWDDENYEPILFHFSRWKSYYGPREFSRPFCRIFMSFSCIIFGASTPLCPFRWIFHLALKNSVRQKEPVLKYIKYSIVNSIVKYSFALKCNLKYSIINWGSSPLVLNEFWEIAGNQYIKYKESITGISRHIFFK